VAHVPRKLYAEKDYEAKPLSETECTTNNYEKHNRRPFASFTVQNCENNFCAFLAKHTNKFHAYSQGMNSGQC